MYLHIGYKKEGVLRIIRVERVGKSFETASEIRAATAIQTALPFDSLNPTASPRSTRNQKVDVLQAKGSARKSS